MGERRIATYKALYPNGLDAEGFASFFEEELDSAFTADLACCDTCYRDYAKKWPGLAGAVQSGSYSLRSFYRDSGFASFFAEKDFLAQCREMGCPSCGAPLENQLYPYNPTFNVPDGLETEIDELGELAIKTPFLVLRHPLARRVFRELKRLKVELNEITEVLFRARPIGVRRLSDEFFAPPSSRCGEGRYNHAGRPVLYLASSTQVAFSEVGSPVEGCLVARVRVKQPQKILDLADTSLPSDLLLAISASALLSSPTTSDGWDKPEYTFSRFIADCAINFGFTALRYPSVAHDSGFNLVLFPQGEWAARLSVEAIAEVYRTTSL